MSDEEIAVDVVTIIKAGPSTLLGIGDIAASTVCGACACLGAVFIVAPVLWLGRNRRRRWTGR